MQIAKDCLDNLERLRQLRRDIEAQAEKVLAELDELGYTVVADREYTIDSAGKGTVITTVKVSRDGTSWTEVTAGSYTEALCKAALKVVME